MWASTIGVMCSDLVENLYCLNGAIAPGKDPMQFVDAAGNGPDTACCECIDPSSPFFTAVGCGKEAVWSDQTGLTCEDYVEHGLCEGGSYGPRWRFDFYGSFGDSKSMEGLTAMHECCDCMRSDSVALLLNGPEECDVDAAKDNGIWYDRLGNSCWTYKHEEWCSAGEVLDAVGRMDSDKDAEGKKASEMCCECIAPTSPDFAARNCSDYFHFWHDAGGYTCADYKNNQWCVAGERGSNWNRGYWGEIADVKDASGNSAKDICCECMDPSSEAYQEQCVAEVDEVELAWVDANGMTCDDYVALECIHGVTDEEWLVAGRHLLGEAWMKLE